MMNPERIFMSSGFTISQETADEGWNMPYTHFHDSYELYILKSGERTVIVDGHEYKTGAHDAVLFNKNVPHRSFGSTPFSGICIHILGSYPDSYFTKKASSRLMECFNSPLIHLDESEFKKIEVYAQKFVQDDDDNFVILAQILTILNSARNRDTGIVPEHSTLTTSQQILQYVEENYIYINSIKEIADSFTVSERYIYKLFSDTHNTTPKAYINALKLKYACHRLKNDAGTVKTAAQKSGFDCYEYFIRLFKKTFGCTPNEYRNQFRA